MALKLAGGDAPPEHANSAQEFSVDLLRLYYGRLFPYQAMFDWLSYGNDPSKDIVGIEKDFFARREWSFTIEDDIYIRYQCFKDQTEMIAAIQKRQPHKIDIGAVFNALPKDNNTIKPDQFKPVERELVFDVDMDDYDRVCCTGANICHRCWPYMTMAVKSLDQALRADFAFQNILWVYSGRRGVHCWVCDPEARALNNEARSAVVEYLTVETDTSDKKMKSPFVQPLHPMIRRAYDTLEPYFERFIADERGQGLLAKRNYIAIVNEMPNDDIRMELHKEWEKNPNMTGAERWRRLKTAVMAPVLSSAGGSGGSAVGKRRKVNYMDLDQWRYELVFKHCYPRLDANVSKSMNHLLKSPFCVHPKTGRVCIPIDPARADEFDPFTVPTVRSLCAEIDAYDRDHMGQQDEDEPVADVHKTSLATAMEVFNKCFMKDLASSIRKNFRIKSEERAAAEIDF